MTDLDINEKQVEETTNALENLITQVKPKSETTKKVASHNTVTQVKPEILPQSPSRTRFPEEIADIPDNLKVKKDSSKEKRKSILKKVIRKPSKKNAPKIEKFSIWTKLFACCGSNYREVLKEEKEKSILIESKQSSIKAPLVIEDTEVDNNKEEKKITNTEIEVEEQRLSVSSETSTTLPQVKKYLLEPIIEEQKHKKCLVLDLDETLVHSSFKLVEKSDFIIPVEIENQIHNVYVAKRPGVDEFMKRMGELYEIVVFTASLAKYADPVLDQLDVHKVVSHRLFRESCYNHNGNYVKDLSQLGRPLKSTIIIDNSPASYAFHPQNAIPISSWFNDLHDTELADLIPFLEDLTKVDSVVDILNSNVE